MSLTLTFCYQWITFFKNEKKNWPFHIIFSIFQFRFGAFFVVKIALHFKQKKKWVEWNLMLPINVKQMVFQAVRLKMLFNQRIGYNNRPFLWVNKWKVEECVEENPENRFIISMIYLKGRTCVDVRTEAIDSGKLMHKYLYWLIYAIISIYKKRHTLWCYTYIRNVAVYRNEPIYPFRQFAGINHMSSALEWC